MEYPISLQEVGSRLDELEALIKEAEGDMETTERLWKQLRHLRLVYDDMIRHSQGRGQVMEQELPDENTRTRDNYFVNVPQASHTAPPSATASGATSESPRQLVINIGKSQGGKMSKSFDEKTSQICEEGSHLRADVNMPLNLQKAKREFIEDVNREKIEEVKKKKKGEGEEEDQVGSAPVKTKQGYAYPKPSPKPSGAPVKTPTGYRIPKQQEEEDVKDENAVGPVFTRALENTLQKSKMKEYLTGFGGVEAAPSPAQKSKVDVWVDRMLESYGEKIKGLDKLLTDLVEKVGIKNLADGLADYGKFRQAMTWAIDGLRHKKLDIVAKAMKMTLEKAVKEKLGGAIVGGIKPTSKAGTYAKLVALKAQLKMLGEHLKESEGNIEKTVEIHDKMSDVQEEYDELLRNSAGMGLVTEEMLPKGVPDYEFRSVFDAKLKSQVFDEVNADLSKAAHALEKELKKAGLSQEEIEKALNGQHIGWRRGNTLYMLSKWKDKKGPANPDLKKEESERAQQGGLQVSGNDDAEGSVDGKKHEPKGPKKLPVAHSKNAKTPPTHDSTEEAKGPKGGSVGHVERLDTTEDTIRHRLGLHVPVTAKREREWHSRFTGKSPKDTGKYGDVPKKDKQSEGFAGINIRHMNRPVLGPRRK